MRADLYSVIELVADRLQNSTIDGCFVLPSFRSIERFQSLEIRPEHLIQASTDPYVLTSIIAKLGYRLGVDYCLIDLRAGLSELADGIILDPRIHRIFVTTLSGQSVEGTVRVLDLIAKYAPSVRENDPSPLLATSQVMPTEMETLFAQQQLKRLDEAVSNCVKVKREDDNSFVIPHMESSFDSALSVLPSDWDQLIDRIKKSEAFTDVKSVLDWLPVTKVVSESNLAQPELPQVRKDFHEWADRLIYAEAATQKGLLFTASLRRLVSDHRTRVPVVVIVGAKGAGKTFTFLQMAEAGSWQDFAGSQKGLSSLVDASFCPVLEPINLNGPMRSACQNLRETVARCLNNGSSALPQTYLRDRIEMG